MFTGERLTVQIWPQYRFVNNALGKIVYADGDTRYQTFDNVLRQRGWQIESYIRWKPFEKTTFVANLNLSHDKYQNPGQGLEQSQTSMNYYFYVAQKLPWKIQATAYTFGQIGRSCDDIYSIDEPFNRYGFSLQRSFLSDDRLTVRLNATAPFHKNMHYKVRTTQGDILGYDDFINAQNNRSFRLSVSFRFGKLKTKVKTTGTTIQNDDVQGGITRGK